MNSDSSTTLSHLSKNNYTFAFRIIRNTKKIIHPVVFLNGAFQNLDSWKRAVKRFKEKSSVLLVDLPGMGYGDILPENTALDFQVECLKLLLKKLNINNVNIFAASYATPLAVRMAQMYPELIDHLVLSGAMKNIQEIHQKRILKAIDFLKKKKIKSFASEAADVLLNTEANVKIEKKKFAHKVLETSLQKLTEKEKIHFINGSIRLFNSELLANQISDVKTLIFTGEHDVFTPPESCLKVAKLFHRCYFTTIKNTDHLNHLENFNGAFRIVEEFFSTDEIKKAPHLNSIQLLQSTNHLLTKKMTILNKSNRLADFLSYVFNENPKDEMTKQYIDTLAKWYGESLLNKNLAFRREVDKKYEPDSYHLITVKNSMTNDKKNCHSQIGCYVRLVIKNNIQKSLPTEDAQFVDQDIHNFKHQMIQPMTYPHLIDKKKNKYVFPKNSVEPTSHRAENMKAMTITFRKMVELCVLLRTPYMVFLINQNNRMHQAMCYKSGCKLMWPYVYFPSFGEKDTNGNIKNPTIWQPWIISLQEMREYLKSTYVELQPIIKKEETRLKEKMIFP